MGRIGAITGVVGRTQKGKNLWYECRRRGG